MIGPQIAMLPDGKRLHLNHGPIDLIIEVFGAEVERRAAYQQAADRFQTILEELVAELPALRQPARPAHNFTGSTARRMQKAVSHYYGVFVTPMAAVAGSVADELLAALTAGRRLDRAYVNNGGDCALYLSPGHEVRLAVGGTGNDLANRVTINAASPARGVATSGWRGRSFSLGIADGVTVLARTGADADVAATLIANAVDLPAHPAIWRQPANELQPDTDLGARLVTVDVGYLTVSQCREALARGLTVADDFRNRGLLEAAALFLRGESRICGAMNTQERLVEEYA